MDLKGRNFLTLKDFTPEEITYLVDLAAELKEKKVFLLNLMSSPGSGKTTMLLALSRALKGRVRMGVMEADIDSAVDAEKLTEAGIRAIQIHTGGMCHLDADMTRQGLYEFGMEDAELIVLENVGNLVCPAEFDTGAVKNMTLLSNMTEKAAW